MKTYSGLTVLAALAALLPLQASALTFVQMLGLFHIVVGLLLTFTLIIFGGAFVLWVARFNTWPSHRDTAISIMEWAIVMIFVLIVLLTLVNFFQRQSTLALTILAFIAVVAAAILIVRMAAQSKKKAASSSSKGAERRRR